MQGLYHGKQNCPGKDAARGFCYASISRTDFFGKTHIVIASRECGDIHYLLRYGVKRSNIIACDIDPVAVERARRTGVRSFDGTIEDCVDWYLSSHSYKGLATVNVDLCRTLDATGSVLDDVLCTLSSHSRHSNGVRVFFTFYRSRDHVGRHGGSRLARLNATLVRSGVHVEDSWCFDYQSWTAGSRGSPMTALAC